MSEQFYCCVFSYIDLESIKLPPVLLSLHGLVVAYGAVVLIDSIDRHTGLVEVSGTYRLSLPTVVYLLQLFVPLLRHLLKAVNFPVSMP